MQREEDLIKFRAVMAELLSPIMAKLDVLDERQSRLEYSLSQPSSPSRGLLGSSGGVSSSFPDRLRLMVEAGGVPIRFAVDSKVEVEYKTPGVKLGERRPGEIPRKRGYWYPATITKDRGDNTYDLVYADGETEIRVPRELIRPVAAAGGHAPSSAPSPSVPRAPRGVSGGGAESRNRPSKSGSAGLASQAASKDFMAMVVEPGEANLDSSFDGGSAEHKDEDGPPPKSLRAEVTIGSEESKAGGSAGGGSSEALRLDTLHAGAEGGAGGGGEGEGEVDEHDGPGGGDESGCVKPWLGAVKPPTKPPVINPEAPSEKLEISWVHGYTSASSGKYAVANNLFYNREGEIVFPAAALGVKIRKNDAGGMTQTFIQAHDDDILCLAVSKCKRFAATGQTASHTSKGKAHVCIWDAASMTLLTRLEACHLRGVLCLSFSPDATKLLTVGLDDDNSHIIFGSTNGWKKTDKVSQDKGDKASFLFSCWVHPSNPITTNPDAKEAFNLVSLSSSNCHLWSVDGAKLGRKKGTLNKKVAAGNVKLNCVANWNTKDGWRVAMGGANGDIFLFEGKEANTSVPSAHVKDIICLAEAGAACNLLVSGGMDKSVKVWGVDLLLVAAFDVTGFAKVDATLGSIDVKPDLSAIVCGTYGGEIIEITPPSPSSSTLDLAGASGTVLQYSHFRGELWGLATHPINPDIVATVGDDSTLRFWSISKSKLVSTTNIGWPGRALAFHPSGNILAVGLMELVKGGVDKGSNSKDKGKKGAPAAGGGEAKGSVLIYTFEMDGEEVVNVEKVATGCPSVAWISEVRFSPSGHMLGVGSHDKRFYAYKVTPGALGDTFKKEKYVFNKHSSAVLHIDFTADGKFVQSTCQAGELLFSDPETGKQETSATKLAEYHGVVEDSDKLRYFETQTCVLGWPVLGIFPPGSDTGDVNSCDRSKNNKLLATSDDFGQIKLFRYPAVDPAAKYNFFDGHSSHVTCCRWSIDNAYLASVGGNDKCLFIWKVLKR